MKIQIRDTSPSFITAANFGFPLEFNIKLRDALVDPADAIVSPANSFGFMDGGIDWAYTKFFGPELQKDVQDAIKTLPFSELLVGQAILVPTRNSHIPNLIVAPTMRLPSIIHDSVDVLLATRAAVRVALQNGYRTITIPGMGTGAGKMAANTAVKRMLQGIDEAFNPPDFPTSWRSARSKYAWE